MNDISYPQRVQVYGQAIERYGQEMQCIVAIEELSECQKEICKVLRGKGNMDHLAEEVADATICLEQVRIMFGLNDMVCSRMDEKVERLLHRLTQDMPTISKEAADALARMGAIAHGSANDGKTEFIYGSSPCTDLPVRKGTNAHGGE